MGHGKKSLEKVEGLGWGTRLVCKMKLLTGGTHDTSELQGKMFDNRN